MLSIVVIVVVIVTVAKVKQQESVRAGVSCHMLATSTLEGQKHDGGMRSEELGSKGSVLVAVEGIVVIVIGAVLSFCWLVGKVTSKGAITWMLAKRASRSMCSGGTRG